MGNATGGGDCWIARFDGAGNKKWSQQFGTGKGDMPYAGAPDGAGGLFVGGFTAGPLGAPHAGMYDAWIARFDGAGNRLWVRQFGSPEYDWLLNLTATSDGGLLACGYTTGNLFTPSLGGADAWVVKYDAAGDPMWSLQFGSDDWEWATCIGEDPTGGFYIGGPTNADFGGQPNKGKDDAWLARFDADTNQEWIRQIGTPDGDYARDIVPARNGGGYFAGDSDSSYFGGGPNAKAWVARFGSDGTFSWHDSVDVQRQGSLGQAAPDKTGGLYLIGITYGDVEGPNAGWGDMWLARFMDTCIPGTTYCVASTTSLPGCTASLTATGSPTLSNPTVWTVSSGPVPGANLGLLLFGSSGKDNTPYGTLGGKLCVAAPTFRTAPKSSGGDPGQCNGSHAFTLADLIAASPVVTSGATINAQVWARDPANVDGFLLSDGIEVVVCP